MAAGLYLFLLWLVMLPLMMIRSEPSPIVILILGILLLLVVCPVKANELTESTIDSVAVTGNLPCSVGDILRGTGLREGASLLTISRGQVLKIVQSNMNGMGYLEATVLIEWPSWDADTSVVTVEVEASRQSLRGALVFQGVTLFPASQLADLYPALPGEVLTPSDTLEFTNAVRKLYGERGYSLASVGLSLLPFDISEPDSFPSTRGIDCIVDEGRQHFLGRITITGLDRVRKKVVLREISLQPGDSLNMNILRQSITNIYSLGLFYDVRFSYEGLEQGRDTIDLDVKVTESRYRSLDIASGYLSPSAVFGSVIWTHPNIMGNNQILSLGVEYTRYFGSNHGERINPELSYEEPWFLSTRWRGRLAIDYLYLDQPALGERSYGGDLSFARELAPDWRLSVGYHLGRSRFWEENEEGVQIQDWTTISSVFGMLVNDTRAPLFNPTSGYWLMGQAKVSGGILGGLNYYMMETGGRLFVSVASGMVLASRLEAGRVTTYDEEGILPPEDRFFLGGGTTVRGYGHNQMGPKNSDGEPLGGNVMVLANIEARVSLFGALGAVLFLDSGGIWDEAEDITIGSAGLGTGMGLRYDTPFGPLRVDYGFAPTWADGFKRGRVYIAIGQAF